MSVCICMQAIPTFFSFCQDIDGSGVRAGTPG